MTATGEPIVKDAGNRTPRNPSEELGPSEERGPADEPGPGEETAEQRRQRRLLRELALRALI
jgi:hypothetical protein